MTAAKRSLKIEITEKRSRTRSFPNKKWFDMSFDKFTPRIPLGIDTVQDLLTSKKSEYYDTKVTESENSTNNSDQTRFWKGIKSREDTVKQKGVPLISKGNWLNYLQSLHSNKPHNSTQEMITNELKHLEIRKYQPCSLDYTITENEIRAAVSKIKNEMIKASINDKIPVYYKLFNSIIHLGTMPSTWCDVLTTFIYKSGNKQEPSNYSGICVSSCLGKLFCFSVY